LAQAIIIEAMATAADADGYLDTGDTDTGYQDIELADNHFRNVMPLAFKLIAIRS